MISFWSIVLPHQCVNIDKCSLISGPLFAWIRKGRRRLLSSLSPLQSNQDWDANKTVARRQGMFEKPKVWFRPQTYKWTFSWFTSNSTSGGGADSADTARECSNPIRETMMCSCMLILEHERCSSTWALWLKNAM